jgi:hypothetical protein
MLKHDSARFSPAAGSLRIADGPATFAPAPQLPLEDS